MARAAGGAIAVQAVIGGTRVLEVSQNLALHGVIARVVFATIAVLAVMSSRPAAHGPTGRPTHEAPTARPLVVGFLYVQIASALAPPSRQTAALLVHGTLPSGGGAGPRLRWQLGVAATEGRERGIDRAPLRRLERLILGAVSAQFLLGILATYGIYGISGGMEKEVSVGEAIFATGHGSWARPVLRQCGGRGLRAPYADPRRGACVSAPFSAVGGAEARASRSRRDLMEPANAVAVMVFLTAALGGWLATRTPGLVNPRAARRRALRPLVTGCASVLNQGRAGDRRTDGPHAHPSAGDRGDQRRRGGRRRAAGRARDHRARAVLQHARPCSCWRPSSSTCASTRRQARQHDQHGRRPVPGAAPVLIGYAALAGEIGPLGWAPSARSSRQFPHFMAIAWMYREDYAGGPPHGADGAGLEGMAGRYAMLYSLDRARDPHARAERDGRADLRPRRLALGVLYIVPSIQFAREETHANARRLLFASIIYFRR